MGKTAPRAEVLGERTGLARRTPETIKRPAGSEAGRADLRWTNREAWHVTLAFLGQVDESAAARLLPRMERAAWRHHVFRLAFAGAGAFPAETRANVLWSGLDRKSTRLN